MAHRRPSRWLAPLALLAAAAALALVISGKASTTGSSSSSSSTATTTTSSGTSAGTTTTTRGSGSASGPRTYRVRSGDTLLRVAARTGVPIERIRALNPSVDANALRVGQILRLRAASP